LKPKKIKIKNQTTTYKLIFYLNTCPICHGAAPLFPLVGPPLACHGPELLGPLGGAPLVIQLPLLPLTPPLLSLE
jgi:hypothetical protein